jgi:hypothetical protein
LGKWVRGGLIFRQKEQNCRNIAAQNAGMRQRCGFSALQRAYSLSFISSLVILFRFFTSFYFLFGNSAVV